MKKPEAIIFDMDGTLFKTETLLVPAYHRLFDRLRAEGLYTDETPPVERILGSLGMLLEEIWKRVMPDASEEARRRADELLLEEEERGLKSGGSELYPNVVETLQALRAHGVKLFVASNGPAPYVEGVARAHGIADYFEELYSAGGRKTASKVDLVRILLDEHQIKSAWMVGDRSSDIEAGAENGLGIIGCAYAGFGANEELEGSHVLIQHFEELAQLYETSEEKQAG
ncbi:HAD family hydrolase [Paenibacillus agilis]|uniref:HAD-IA family hydrolase n=1 Tax=Paenibacillus agilis TaxID=3020863 RepID=A0A559IXE8_9BACL|nr:HAD-IA family hydrolase [Paenibacillus agilis]TVX92314.1 HAD-IA family hydrolase [Paenibacillus agilis]